MKKTLFATVAAIAISATAAFGQTATESIVSQLQGMGYSHIEVKVGTTTIKVEAIRDGMKREFFVDVATGEISGDHTRPVGPGDDSSDGVEISQDGSVDDDGIGHDSNDDHNGDDHNDDDHEDDDHGDDEDHGHDKDDDHGSDHDD